MMCAGRRAADLTSHSRLRTRLNALSHSASSISSLFPLFPLSPKTGTETGSRRRSVTTSSGFPEAHVSRSSSSPRLRPLPSVPTTIADPFLLMLLFLAPEKEKRADHPLSSLWHGLVSLSCVQRLPLILIAPVLTDVTGTRLTLSLRRPRNEKNVVCETEKHFHLSRRAFCWLTFVSDHSTHKWITGEEESCSPTPSMGLIIHAFIGRNNAHTG